MVTSGMITIITHTIKTKKNKKKSTRGTAYNIDSIAMNVINDCWDKRDECTPLT